MEDNIREHEGLSKAEELDSLEIIADPKQTPIRIDKFLMDRLHQVSRNRIQNGLIDGRITVNDEQVKPNYKIRPGDRIFVTWPKSKMPDHIIPEEIPLDVIYEDDYLLVINKPAGMVVHPGIGNYSGTLVNAVAHHLNQLDLPVLPGNDDTRPGLVHRIDKDTSGLLVLAKTSEVLTHLAKQFADHTSSRTYLAIIWGEPSEHEGTIDVPLGIDPKNRTLRAVQEDGKRAITHYQVIEGLYLVSMIRCRLETGRTHQIRVHLQHLGHPIFNDSKYRGDVIRKGTVFSKYKQFVENSFQVCPRHALHAATLGFDHPINGKRLEFKVPLPDDMQQVWDRWKNYVSNRKELL